MFSRNEQKKKRPHINHNTRGKKSPAYCREIYIVRSMHDNFVWLERFQTNQFRLQKLYDDKTGANKCCKKKKTCFSLGMTFFFPLRGPQQIFLRAYTVLQQHSASAGRQTKSWTSVSQPVCALPALATGHRQSIFNSQSCIFEAWMGRHRQSCY